MTLGIRIDNYNYFGGHNVKFVELPLMEAWEYYKTRKSDDFDYEDAWQKTTIHRVPQKFSRYEVQRPHTRSLSAWQKMNKQTSMKLSEEEKAYLLSFFDDEDEEIMI